MAILENLLRAALPGYGGAQRDDPYSLRAALLTQGAIGLESKSRQRQYGLDVRGLELREKELENRIAQYDKQFAENRRQFDLGFEFQEKTYQGAIQADYDPLEELRKFSAVNPYASRTRQSQTFNFLNRAAKRYAFNRFTRANDKII